jgi:hypothetical protein
MALSIDLIDLGDRTPESDIEVDKPAIENAFIWHTPRIAFLVELLHNIAMIGDVIDLRSAAAEAASWSFAAEGLPP